MVRTPIRRSAPWWLVAAYLAFVAVVACIALLSDAPLDVEEGPLSFVDAFLLFVMAGLLMTLSTRPDWQTPVRAGCLMGTVLAFGIGVIQIVGLLDGETQLVEELDVGNSICWLVAGGFLVWMLRVARPVRLAEQLLLAGFVLQSFSLFADVTDGMWMALPDLFDWLFGPGEEISEVLFLATYCAGFALLAGTSAADALTPRETTDGDALPPALAIRQAYLTARWHAMRPSEIPAQMLLTLGAPLRFAAVFGWHCLHSHARVERSHGKDALRQAAEAIAAAFADGVPAENYYKFEMFVNERRAVARHYIHRREFKGPGGVNRQFKALRRRQGRTTPLGDKAAFARHCLAQGLPTIPLLAFGRDGRLLQSPPDGMLPQQDLFAKPIKGRGGHGAEAWRWTGQDRYRCGDGRTLDGAGLLQHVADSGMVLQPRRRNHVELAAIAGGALATVRAVTCLDERLQPELTHAVLRMARDQNATVDNFHAGGIAAAVDLAIGRLGRATDLGLKDSGGWHATHPLSGARIEDRVLPHWAAVRSLALEAHARFCDHAIIGWDIAILADGVELVEGNSAPDLDIVQRVHGAPAGLDRLGALLAHHALRAAERR